jgi:hypothetical protein
MPGSCLAITSWLDLAAARQPVNEWVKMVFEK